jgi:hypothetical protein
MNLLVAKTFLIAAATVFFATEVVAQMMPQPGMNQNIAKQESVPVRILPKDMFCKRLQSSFVEYASTTGYNKLQTAMLASTASQMVVQEFRNGRASDYMDAAALAHYAQQPDLAPKNSYLQMAAFVGNAMGLSPRVSLALGTGELRFITYAQADTDIVVIAQNAAPLTAERAAKIVEVARSLKVRISAIWVGSDKMEDADMEKTRLLGWIVAMTGGSLTNLGGTETACGTLM